MKVFSDPVAQQRIHDYTGYLMIPLAFGLLWLLKWYWEQLYRPVEQKVKLTGYNHKMKKVPLPPMLPTPKQIRPLKGTFLADFPNQVWPPELQSELETLKRVQEDVSEANPEIVARITEILASARTESELFPLVKSGTRTP